MKETKQLKFSISELVGQIELLKNIITRIRQYAVQRGDVELRDLIDELRQ